MGWTIQFSNPGTGKKFFSSPKPTDHFWVPPSHLFYRYHSSFQEI